MYKDYFGKDLKLGDNVIYATEFQGKCELRHGKILSLFADEYNNLLEIEYAAVNDFDSDEHDNDFVNSYNVLKVDSFY